MNLFQGKNSTVVKLKNKFYSEGVKIGGDLFEFDR
jgi:hypothetical protein